MSATATDWETFGVWIPSTAFEAVDSKDSPGLWSTDFYLFNTAQSDQPADLIAPSAPWCPTHVLSLVVDDELAEWWELWSGDPEHGGKRLNGRFLPAANDIAIPLPAASKRRFHLRVQTPASQPTVNLLIARKARGDHS